MKTPQIIDTAFLDALSQQAQQSPRKRKNYNFHADENDASHRLLNGLEPNTYIVPHRHLAADKDESIFFVRGKIGAIFFDEAGNITATTVMSAQGPAFGLNIPAGTFHTLIALAPESLFFEAKAGPYAPLLPEERAPWAPLEGEKAAMTYLAELSRHFV